MRHTFASKVASLFREHLDYTEDVETEWDLFKLAVITSAAATCCCKLVGGQMGNKKRTAWWNKKIKKAIRAKKTAFRDWLTNKSSEQLRLRYSAARKTAATIVKQSKEKSWKEYGQKLDTDYRSANKIFWQTIRCLRCRRTPCATFVEDTNGVLLNH